MPRFELSQQSPTAVTADVLAVFAGKGKNGFVLGGYATALGEALGLDLTGELTGVRFEGDLGATARISTREGVAALVVGKPDRPRGPATSPLLPAIASVRLR